MTMLTDREETLWKGGVWLLSTLFVFFVFASYEVVVYFKSSGSFFPNIMPQNLPIILGFLTTFSITMTGFIAAIGAYLLTVSRSAAFTEWRDEGYLSIFFHLYGAAIVFLLLTFSLCVLMVLDNMAIVWLKLILCLVILNFIHIILITFIAVNQAKSGDEESSSD